MSDIKVDKVDSAFHSKFLEENPPEDPYSLPPLLDAYRETFSRDVEYLRIARSQTAIASCAVFVGTRLSSPIVKLMPLRAYDGVHFRALDESAGQKQEYDRLMALEALEAYLRSNFSFYQLVFRPGFIDMRPFQWAGAKVTPRYTYILDLPRLSPGNYTKSLREVLKSADLAGLHPCDCSVSELVSLNELSYERHSRRPPVGKNDLGRILEKLDKAGLLRTKCIKNADGKVVSAITSLRTDDGLYMYVGGTDASAGKGASHLLYHEILTEEKSAGRAFVDFVGANTPTINLFKSSFGPRLEVYFHVWRANSIPARIASVVKKI